MSEIPTLRRKQHSMDRATGSLLDEKLSKLEKGQLKVACTATEINHTADAVRDVISRRPLDERVLSLDAEWDTVTNSRGMVVASKRVATIQLGYKDPDTGQIRSVVLQTHKFDRLPARLVALLNDPTLR